MLVNGQKQEYVKIQGENGVCVTITDTGAGNLRITETGQFFSPLLVIPQNSNSVIITSTREQY